MKKIVVATNNAGKIKDFERLLWPLGYEVLPIAALVDDFNPEETGKTFEENALVKAFAGMKKTQLACLADDSGLEVDVLNKAPGIYSARYAGNLGDQANNEKLLKELEGLPPSLRSARFVSVIALVYPNESYLVGKGYLKGRILHSPQGSNGFGYDPLFYIPSLSCSMAELSLEEKNKISHRQMAFASLQQAMREVKNEGEK